MLDVGIRPGGGLPLGHDLDEMRSLVFLLAAFAATVRVSARVNLVERLSACRDAGTLKVLGNATFTSTTGSGHTAQFSTTYCPAADSASASESPETKAEDPSEVNKRQTCTQCPCANGSITCYCHTLGSQNSLFIDTCTNSTPPGVTIPNYDDCLTLAALVSGVPSGSLGESSLHVFLQ
uniref:Uncharacterized protein n=1 Tax=Mycena chlorophos TaxID=658473 RepID=A0ABQ0KU85_MYCCL|nr:predicted protein [Mycena chlorophos]